MLSNYVHNIADMVIQFMTLIPYSFSQSAEFLVMALGFWYGSQLLASGGYTPQQFFTIFIAVVFGGSAAAQFFTWTTSITKAEGGANYLFWLRTIPASIRDTPENHGKGPSGYDISIGLEAVDFIANARPLAYYAAFPSTSNLDNSPPSWVPPAAAKAPSSH
jgi:ATP-binding cassette, subfamily B (MDR/TAP), member 1